MGFGGVQFGSLVEACVDGVQLGTEFAFHVEPPVADEDCLAELGTVGAEEGCLASIDVAVVPRLASGLHVGEEAWVGLVLAVEIRVGDDGQNWVVGARTTCK